MSMKAGILGTYRPDLSVNDPNLRAFTAIECFMRSDLYASWAIFTKVKVSIAV